MLELYADTSDVAGYRGQHAAETTDDETTTMKDTPDAPRKPDEWTIGYIAAVNDVFRHLDDIKDATVSIYFVRVELADRLGLSNEARQLLNRGASAQLPFTAEARP